MIGEKTVFTGHLEPMPIVTNPSIDYFSQIEVRPRKYVTHERHYRVTFWQILSNFSGLALGVYSSAFFIMGKFNFFE